MKALALFATGLALLGGSVAQATPCKTGCAVAQHSSETPSRQEMVAWLQAYAEDAPSEPGLALETLLFHGALTTSVLAAEGRGVLDDVRRTFLEAQLARTSAIVELRLVDDAGQVVADERQSVKLGAKVHFELHPEGSLQPFAYSGTVKRVGLFHVWGRL